MSLSITADEARRINQQKVEADQRAAEEMECEYEEFREELFSLVNDCIMTVVNSPDTELQHGLETSLVLSGGVFSNEFESDIQRCVLSEVLVDLTNRGFGIERVYDIKLTPGIRVFW